MSVVQSQTSRIESVRSSKVRAVIEDPELTGYSEGRKPKTISKGERDVAEEGAKLIKNSINVGEMLGPFDAVAAKHQSNGLFANL